MKRYTVCLTRFYYATVDAESQDEMWDKTEQLTEQDFQPEPFYSAFDLSGIEVVDEEEVDRAEQENHA